MSIEFASISWNISIYHIYQDEVGYISAKKNIVCFVQISQQSYLKIFQNVMLIIFSAGIYMEINNWRVGDFKVLVVRCYILNQKDPGSNPTIRLLKRKFTQGRPVANWEIPKPIRRIVVFLK